MVITQIEQPRNNNNTKQNQNQKQQQQQTPKMIKKVSKTHRNLLKGR